jgi:hypothetical protein
MQNICIKCVHSDFTGNMLKDRLIQITSTLSLIAIQATIWPLILHTKDLPNQVPLWYVLPSASRLAPISYFWYIPILACFFWLSNTAIAYLLYRRNPRLAQGLTCISVAITCMAAITILKTVSIYTSLL